MKTKNILVIVESLDVNDSSATKGRVAFIENLNNAGFNVTVLHFTQKEIKIEHVNCILVKEEKGTVNYILSRCQRLLFRHLKIDISRYVNSLLGFSFGFFNDVHSLSKAIRKYSPNDFDMLWTFGKGTSFRAHAAVLKNPDWFNKWYAFVHDPYPQHLYPRPYNFVEYGFKKKRYFFRDVTIHAHRLIFPSLLLKEWMQSYFIKVEGKSLIIPHQIVSRQMLKTKLPPYFNPSNFNILQAGNLLDLRDPKPIIIAYKKFLEAVPSARADSALLFLGKSSVFHNYLRQKQNKMPQLYISEGYVDFEDVYTMQSHAAINIILEAKSEISPFLPGKFPHCVAANKPILVVGPYYSECRRLLGKEYPFLYEFDEVDRIFNGIVTLYSAWKENKTLNLNRDDLVYYLSSNYLKDTINEENAKVI